MLAWVLLGGLLLAAKPQENSVAMVLSTTGDVTLRRGGEDQPAAMMTLVREGDMLMAQDKSQATLMYFGTHRRVRLKPAVTVTVSKDGCQPDESVELLPAIAAMTSHADDKLKKLATSGRGGAITVRRGGGNPQVHPMYEATVLSMRPEFSWPSHAQAKKYIVRMKDSPSHVLWKAETRQPRLDFPDVAPLVPSKTYTWEVDVVAADGVSHTIAKSRFGTASESVSRTLGDLRQSADSDDPALLMAVAAIYHQHGVYDLALPLYERLAQLKPNEPFLFAALKDCYQAAGRVADAEAANERAERLGWMPSQ
jgi:hypothetical protein